MCRLGRSRVAEYVGSASTTIGNSNPLAFVDGHHPNALGALLDDRRFIDFAAFCVSFDALDEGAKGRRTPLKSPSRIDQPLTIGERLFAILPKSDTSLSSDGLQKHRKRLRDRPTIAADMKSAQKI